MPSRLRQIARTFKRECRLYRSLAHHPRTPRVSRWLLALAIGYALSPIDLVPDFIPVLGHVDDLFVVPGLVLLALHLIPRNVIAECRTLHAEHPPTT